MSTATIATILLLGVSGAFTYLLTYLRIPTMIATGLFSITSNKIVILVPVSYTHLFRPITQWPRTAKMFSTPVTGSALYIKA